MLKLYDESLKCLWKLLNFQNDVNLQNAAIIVIEKYHNALLKRAKMLSDNVYIPDSNSKPCEHYEMVCFARLREWKANPPKKKSDRLPIIKTDIDLIKSSLDSNQDDIKNDFFVMDNQDNPLNVGHYLYKRKLELQKKEKDILKEEEELKKKEKELKQLEESLFREMFNEGERRYKKNGRIFTNTQKPLRKTVNNEL